MENNNNNKKKNGKAIWIISSLLSVAVLGLGAVIAWKLFAPNTQQNNITVEKENLLFKKNDIEPFKLNIEKTKWAEDEFKTNYQSLSLREFTKSNLKVDGNSISNLIEEVYPISKKEIQINLSKYSNFNYLLSEDVTRELSYLVNNLLYIDNLDVEFIQGVRIMNLNFLIEAIDNFIRDPLKKYTISDFVKYIGEGDNENKKQFIEKVIQPNLFITPTTNIDLANIKDVRFDSNNNLLIELQNEGIKYYIDVQDEVGNVSISNNIITIE
ncbi:MAG: hypothetical protein K2I49_00480, partial [Ureaplasma sp.]|nr:hypothetical protein [Ureaplasma sp.]